MDGRVMLCSALRILLFFFCPRSQSLYVSFVFVFLLFFWSNQLSVVYRNSSSNSFSFISRVRR